MSAGPVVAVVGSLLVAASPLRAGESGVRVQGIGPDQLDQESPDFRDGEGDRSPIGTATGKFAIGVVQRHIRRFEPLGRLHDYAGSAARVRHLCTR